MEQIKLNAIKFFIMTIQIQSCKTLFVCFLFPILVLVGCGLPKPTQTQGKQKPGLYGLTGWNDAWMNPATDVANPIEIDGKVGYKLELAGPTANCVSPSKKWTSYIRIISGEFPPGIYIEEGTSIRGTPEKRGHYIAVVEMYGIKCNDMDYGSMKQELRFHITGSGIVNDGEGKELVNDDKATISYVVTQNEVKFIIKTNASPSIKVDVTRNGVIDDKVDRSYGMEIHKLLCAQYLIDESRSTRCGGAPSSARLSVGASLYVFTIPKSELTSQSKAGTISVMFEISSEENGGWTTKYFPYGTRRFENFYNIDIR